MTGQIDTMETAIEGILSDFEAGTTTKEETVTIITHQVIDWVFQESCSWAAQVRDVHIAGQQVVGDLANKDTRALYSEMRKNLTKRIAKTFELAEKLEGKTQKKGK